MIGTNREVAVAKRGGHFAFVALSAAALASVLALSFGLALPVQAQSSTNTITVNSAQDNTDDDEQCTLREAIDNANSDSDTSGGDCAGGGGEDRIVFDIPASEPGCASEDVCTITLGSQLPTITDGDGLSIEGEENDITVSGSDAVRVLQVNSGVELAVGNLTVADGLADSSGGGILNQGGTLEVTNSTFSQNSAESLGAGIFNTLHGTLTVTNSTFSQNSAENPAGGENDGGGIFNNSGTLEVTNSTFSQNSVEDAGGGILNNSRGTLTVTNSTFSQNSAGLGGGIENFGTLEVTNSTFSNNSARNFGGGIENISEDGTLTVTNSTFSQNSAQVGGGISNRGSTATLANTIVANSPSGENCLGNLPITDEGGNLDDGSSCAFTAASSKSNAEDGLDPDGLKDNGGPTQTIALLPASEAIDMGVEETCAAPPVDNLDQRGVSRPQDGDGDGTATCDIGAFELNRPPVAINDPYSVSEDQTLTVNAPGVLINDTDDAQGDDLSATVVTGPQNASSFSLNPDGSFSYTPNTNFEGTDSFTYTANDGTNDSNVATVVISVIATKDPPSANDDTDQTEKNTPIRINVLSNDFDIDGDRLTVTSASDPANGTTTVNSDNTVTYTPDEDYVSQSGSPDSFTYTIDDPSGETDTATVSVEVGDTGAPSVVSVSPINATDTAFANTKVKATFSENIDPATLDESTFTLVKDGTTNPVSATVTLDSSGKKAILDPDNPLKPNTTYTATVKGGVGGVADLSGNELTGDEVWFFGVNSAPQITYPRPSPDSEVRTRTPTIQATVTDAQTDLRGRNITLSVDGNNITTFTYNGRIDRLEYKPANDLSLGNHRVRITAVDAQGLRTTRTWTFEVVQ